MEGPLDAPLDPACERPVPTLNETTAAGPTAAVTCAQRQSGASLRTSSMPRMTGNRPTAAGPTPLSDVYANSMSGDNEAAVVEHQGGVPRLGHPAGVGAHDLLLRAGERAGESQARRGTVRVGKVQLADQLHSIRVEGDPFRPHGVLLLAEPIQRRRRGWSRRRTRAPCAGRRCGTRVTPSSPLVGTGRAAVGSSSGRHAR